MIQESFFGKVCPKLFSEAKNLKIHKKTHTCEPPFPCDWCPKSFTVAGDLKKHREIHTEKKPFPCH